MNFRALLILTFALSFFSFLTKAQISVVYPLERTVFQRDNSQKAYIHITGNYYSNIDSIQVRLTPKNVGWGTALSWTRLNCSISSGYYSGKILANQGWYQLDIRAFSENTVINTVSVNRVGIGEVFVIAGQSNAQGGAADGFGATDDRVNSVWYSNDYSDYNKLPLGFSQLQDSSAIGPFHFLPWAWGKLGDLLTQRLNVPILFYGAGHGGTSSYQWRQSALGLPYDGPSWMIQSLGAPYRALQNSLSFYASLTGIRGVLWHQGESDPDTAPLVYFDNMQKLIDKTRENSEHSSLAWIIARASINPWFHGNVIEGQNYTIQNHPNVFAGPYTDGIVGGEYRSDGIHFNTTAGLIAFANSWDTSLDANFFSNSIPMMASPFIDVTTTNHAPNMTISVPASYAQYAWSNRQNTAEESKGISNFYRGADMKRIFYPVAGYEAFNWKMDSTNSISVNTGRFSVNVRKISRKTLFGVVLNVISSPIPTSPTISASATQIRPTESVTLTSSVCPNGWVKWSNGSLKNPLTLTPTSTLSYQAQCLTPYFSSNNSNTISVIVSTCFPNSLWLSGIVNSPQQPYQSQVSVQSTQAIQHTGNIQYSAAKKVELLPGFEVKNGGVFKATIQGCNQ